MTVLKVCLLLLFLAGVTTARMDLSHHLRSNHHDSSDESSESSKACCDLCTCTKSIPPQCQCKDMRLNSCHSACKSCICALSEPAQCFCVDTTDFCYKPCHNDAAKDLVNKF